MERADPRAALGVHDAAAALVGRRPRKAVGVNIVLTAVALLGWSGSPVRCRAGGQRPPRPCSRSQHSSFRSWRLSCSNLCSTATRRCRTRAGGGAAPTRGAGWRPHPRRARPGHEPSHPESERVRVRARRTRRVVVSDTLLEQASPAEVRLVVAHELAHRRKRHVLLGTLLAMAGAVTTTVVVWALLGTRVGDPHQVPLVLLIGLAIGLISLPALTAVSRRWERAADRYSLELTGDRAAYETAFRRLAQTNLTDLDPPRLLYLLLFTHPTPPERLAAAA